MNDSYEKPIFVTGATGYVGGRLVPRLLEQGYRVRCYARSPEKLADRSWMTHPGVEVVQGDMATAGAQELAEAMSGCGAAYYLVHAMVSSGSTYESEDRRMAETFARMQEHLLVNGVDVEQTPRILGPWLTMDPRAERFTGELAEGANRFVRRDYRTPFVVPEQV